jgi:purine-nucleoside phosphorylase
MSTVPEVLAARHMGIRCAGFSAITDLGVPGRIRKVLIQDVIRAAEQAGEAMGQIILSGLQSAQRKA